MHNMASIKCSSILVFNIHLSSTSPNMVIGAKVGYLKWPIILEFKKIFQKYFIWKLQNLNLTQKDVTIYYCVNEYFKIFPKSCHA
jgi:hypothetical protein